MSARASPEEEDTIKSGWLSVWHTAPVQNQVEKVQSFAKARVSEVPGMLYSGVRKVATVIASDSPAEPAPTKAAKPAAKSAGTSTTKATGASKKSASTKPAAGSTGAGAKK